MYFITLVCFHPSCFTLILRWKGLLGTVVQVFGYIKDWAVYQKIQHVLINLQVWGHTVFGSYLCKAVTKKKMYVRWRGHTFSAVNIRCSWWPSMLTEQHMAVRMKIMRFFKGQTDRDLNPWGYITPYEMSLITVSCYPAHTSLCQTAARFHATLTMTGTVKCKQFKMWLRYQY